MLLSANAGIRSIDHLADLGYEAIDIGFVGTIYEGDRHDPILDGEDWITNLNTYSERARARNIKIGSSHLPYRYDYTDPSSPGFQKNYEMTCRALLASEYLGAEWAVMHMADVGSTVAFVKRLFADTGVQNVGIAIENMYRRPISELIRAHDILKKEGYRVGICLDIGHCHINSVYDNDVCEVIREMGARIQVLHVHDNCRNTDAHKAPFCGTAPWNDVMYALKEIGYTGDFNYELQAFKIPEPARLAYERYCVDIGRYLISVYNQ